MLRCINKLTRRRRKQKVKLRHLDKAERAYTSNTLTHPRPNAHYHDARSKDIMSCISTPKSTSSVSFATSSSSSNNKNLNFITKSTNSSSSSNSSNCSSSATSRGGLASGIGGDDEEEDDFNYVDKCSSLLNTEQSEEVNTRYKIIDENNNNLG